MWHSGGPKGGAAGSSRKLGGAGDGGGGGGGGGGFGASNGGQGGGGYKGGGGGGGGLHSQTNGTSLASCAEARELLGFKLIDITIGDSRCSTDRVTPHCRTLTPVIGVPMPTVLLPSVRFELWLSTSLDAEEPAP